MPWHDDFVHTVYRSGALETAAGTFNCRVPSPALGDMKVGKRVEIIDDVADGPSQLGVIVAVHRPGVEVQID